MLNGGNGKKYLKKDDNAWKFTYMSSAYVLLRQAWLMDYMEANLKMLKEMKNEYLSKTMQTAYEMSLAKHHPWILQKTIKLGQLTCTTMTNFQNSIINGQNAINKNKEYKMDTIYSDFKIMENLFNGCAKGVWGFLKENDLTDIP